MFACGAPPMAQQPRAAPKLRVLCLHGMGTSAAILQRQLRPLVDATLDDVEYAFLDGQEECPPADAAIATVFPGGPYRRYCARRRDAVPAVAGVTCGDVYDNIDAAVAHTVRAIDEQGPFDGILGFSQGANVATIVCSHLWKDSPPPVSGPLRFAVLMCGTQFGWAAQLPHLFPVDGSSTVLKAPSLHVHGDIDPFKPTSQVLARLWAAVDEEGAALQRTVCHPSGHRPLPPGRDASATVQAVKHFFIEQRRMQPTEQQPVDS